MDDLTTMLESVVLLGCPYVIGGDFNVHMEDPVDADAVSLTSILASFGLIQRVEDPTHQLGGTLDLVIASEDFADVSVAVDPPGAISDHQVVIADLPTRPVKQPAPSRTVRGWRSVDRITFSEAVARCHTLMLAPRSCSVSMTVSCGPWLTPLPRLAQYTDACPSTGAMVRF